MLEKIEKDLKERMSIYTDSRQPSDDEVRIAWLVSEIEELTGCLKRKPIKNNVCINSYPSNYVEEDMPQILVEVRYRKDFDPDEAVRKKEALVLATKLEIIINEIL